MAVDSSSDKTLRFAKKIIRRSKNMLLFKRDRQTNNFQEAILKSLLKTRGEEEIKLLFEEFLFLKIMEVDQVVLNRFLFLKLTRGL